MKLKQSTCPSMRVDILRDGKETIWGLETKARTATEPERGFQRVSRVDES